MGVIRRLRRAQFQQAVTIRSGFTIGIKRACRAAFQARTMHMVTHSMPAASA